MSTKSYAEYLTRTLKAVHMLLDAALKGTTTALLMFLEFLITRELYRIGAAPKADAALLEDSGFEL